MQWFQYALAIGVQAIEIKFGIVIDYIAQCREPAVVHVGRGEGNVAQARYPELAEIAMLRFNITRAGCRSPGQVVVVRAEKIEAALLQFSDTTVPAWVNLAPSDEER